VPRRALVTASLAEPAWPGDPGEHCRYPPAPHACPTRLRRSRTGPRRRRRGSGTATGRGRRAGHAGRPCSVMARRAAWRWDEQPAGPSRLAPPVPARGGSRGL